MQCRYEQLHQQLNKPVLAPIYLISGEEVVLIQAACNAIRLAVKKAGFTDRQIFYADTHFNGATLSACMNNYGLFADKQLLELHLSPGSYSETLIQTLILYAKNPPPNKLLLIIAGKMDRRLQQTTWFKSINQIGLIIPIWPLQPTQLFRWVTERFHSMNLKIEKAAIECLIFATEGNLLATAQTIEKLSLYFEKNNVITIDMLMQALSDNARFDPFKLVDAALEGNSQRCLRILAHLKEEGIEPLLILWALSRECRLLASFAFELNKGKNLITLFKEQQVWEKRQLLLQHALKRHTLTHWYQLLGLASRIDQLIKGLGTGHIWNALQTLSLEIAEPHPL